MIVVNHGTANVTLAPGTSGVNDGGGTNANYQLDDLAMAVVVALRATNVSTSTFIRSLQVISANSGPPA